ncbi:MAG: hypothetical protein WAW46_07505 [Polaromonas sp.]
MGRKGRGQDKPSVHVANIAYCDESYNDSAEYFSHGFEAALYSRHVDSFHRSRPGRSTAFFWCQYPLAMLLIGNFTIVSMLVIPGLWPLLVRKRLTPHESLVPQNPADAS